ncbi:TatD family hydrolase [Paraburkholderia caballeronis]|uniref:TatD DNase family protein n=1 Tax=Paraburkholderia caballeronis TaxID=416943 RepID=A0A1H7JGE6_9BURK|nr:TatD family hydrolase [Paraburkholderia caballeronis]PXW27455.1 TatD DNase family protein [Paraburkholderia caballeronis]PXX02929.1 TatD DNase family protein [Paraburkholderia caballeronis]RAK03654.1 TatD DNase family protein [Paraburkholderia caballeronis]SEC27754.1 TatD DNase family protein [Paraburkholderia caballeronis]SEK73060.1 TatD DNase family protein [Paraburkholderia caballeronis]
MFVDSHCHINFEGLADRLPQVLDNMRSHSVTHALCVSVDLETLPSVLDIAARYDNVYASVGVHPDHEDAQEPSVAELVELAAHPKVVAIGETGLDYYRLGERTIADMEWQRERFRTHIRAAHATSKPLIIHTRAASDDTLRIMDEERAGVPGGVMHCFTEPWPIAERALAQNFYISLSGIVTFKSATDVQDVARRVPLDRLLIETDSPYLAPVPYRGKPNEPAYVSYVGRFIAQQRALTDAELADATTQNFFRLFRIPAPVRA